MTMKVLMLAFWATTAVAEGEPKNVLALPTAWKDEAGAPVALEHFKGRWYALTFVYTSCAGSCPLTTKKLKRLDAALEQAGKPLELLPVSARSLPVAWAR